MRGFLKRRSFLCGRHLSRARRARAGGKRTAPMSAGMLRHMTRKEMMMPFWSTSSSSSSPAALTTSVGSRSASPRLAVVVATAGSEAVVGFGRGR